MHEAEQSFAYEVKGNSAVIWRCFSRDMRVEIPAEIEGYPVTHVAPYAFSAHMREGELERGLASGKLKLYVPELFQNMELPPLCGDQLEEVVFPESVKHIGRYCFYNCSNLRRLEFWGELADWGSGVFTGCHHVRELKLYTDKEQRSYITDVLDELPEELSVEYMICRGDSTYEESRLIIPEYYEEGIENTPARILEFRIHGSGMRYRNCFKGRKLDFIMYDEQFFYAKILETDACNAALAMNRLRFPVDLSETAREQYLEFIKDHKEAISDILLQKRDMEGIRWLLANDESVLELLTDRASRMHYSEALSYLMEYRRIHTGPQKKRKRLSL